MCGIVGICGDINIRIQDLLDKIKHRGPDDRGEWKYQDFALGFARLSIIDLSPTANQPMKDNETENVIVFNGEIYNYRELREELMTFHNFKTQSDTEVILAAYKKWGPECLKKLRGMFSLALFDKSKNLMLAARDRIGIKPFYYRTFPYGTIFSSEIKSLVSVEKIENDVNTLKAAEFLCARQLDCNHETLFRDVYQLQPGTYVWIDHKGRMSAPLQYWDFPSHGNINFSINKHGKEFTELFEESINLHLRSDVPVGAFVSGGLDSSSIASFVLSSRDVDELHTFSAVLPVQNEENKLISLITDHPKVHKHEFYLDGQGFFDEIEKVVYHNDEPIQDGSMYSHFKLCEIASAHGVKVLLSGSGGDELLGGYASHVFSSLATTLKELNIPKYLRRISTISSNSSYTRNALLRKSFQEILPFKLRRKYKHNYFQKVASHTTFTTIVDDLPFYYYTDPDPWTANYINNYKSWSVPPYLHYEDRNSMAFGVEVRVPFYDHLLIEYIARFHPDSLIDGRSKSILRESFKNRVPDKILNQKAKLGFPSPVDSLLRKKELIAPLFAAYTKDVPFLIPEKTKKLSEDFFENKVDIGVFWRTLSLAIWYKKFFNS
ncbi:MAG TPA: asparagine synthase (glutamine-hydrolyzing) [Saprospiraceae bacterium]|nr:asparagine synthase (glutamine-hydrolyzing) [Saprospiraceae bacterium]